MRGRIKGIYKHSEETKRKIGKANKGRKQKEWTKEMRERASKRMMGKKIHLGIKDTLIGRHNKSLARRGNLAPLWKGGKTKLSKIIRSFYKYKEWSKDVFKRDNYTCQECGGRCEKGFKVRLEAHHIKDFSIILEENNIKTIEDAEQCEELWNISNGKTLCIDCHKLTKTYGNKKTKRR